MSHHFDTPTAQQDPRINVCDFYLFRGRPGTTVFPYYGAPFSMEEQLGLPPLPFGANRKDAER